jgi:hypothetical protein
MDFADVYLAIALSQLIFIGLITTGATLARRMSRAGAAVVLLVGVGALLVHALLLLDNVIAARWLPVSSLIVLGNLSVPVVGLLIGVGMRQLPRPWWRRAILLVPLAGLCLYKAYSPVFASPPQTFNRWQGAVCMQTSDSTCAAAATATLLAYHHILATESQMAQHCFTSPAGTTMHGIYRGLKIMTRGTPLRVRPITGDRETLRAALQDGPVLISVGLRRGQQADPRYASLWGWTPGTMHTVIVYSIDTHDRVQIGDPRIGLEFWDIDGIRTLWHGQGWQLVKEPAISAIQRG